MVTNVTIGFSMLKRVIVFQTADRLWVDGTKPSVRKIISEVGGSARDVAPLLKLWWLERSHERRNVAGAELGRLEQQYDDQRRFYMQQIDNARQEAKAAQDSLSKAQTIIQYYKKLLKDSSYSTDPKI